MPMSAALLTAVVFLPAAGALLAWGWPEASDEERSGHRARGVALGVSLLEFALALALWWTFERGPDGFSHGVDAPWIPALGVSFRLGVDGISLVLILLTAFLVPLTLLGAWTSIARRRRAFVICVLLLETGVMGAFAALDLFLFYVFWEAMLVPMYFLIGVWGGARRVYAALKFFVFTMAGSLLMLVAILVVAAQPGGGFDFGLSAALARSFDPDAAKWLFWAFAVAFAIKVPVVPLHTWLPDAHVEAPTPGSVLLAGVLLKLGIYGYIRFAFPVFPEAALAALPVLGWLGVVGVVYGALVAWVQPDMKKLVAYSSVSHLGFCMLGLAAGTEEGVAGSVFIMIAHGVSTPALFLLVGVLYEQRHTRKLGDYGGLAAKVPVFAFFLVASVLASAGLPGLSGFPGEFMVLLGTFTAPGGRTWALIAASGVILAAVYLLWMTQRILFGPMSNPANEGLRDMNLRETSVLATLTGFALVIGLFPGLVVDPIRPDVAQLLRRVGTPAADTGVLGGPARAAPPNAVPHEVAR